MLNELVHIICIFVIDSHSLSHSMSQEPASLVPPRPLPSPPELPQTPQTHRARRSQPRVRSSRLKAIAAETPTAEQHPSGRPPLPLPTRRTQL